MRMQKVLAHLLYFPLALSLVSGKSFADGKGRDWDNEEPPAVGDDQDHCLVPSALLKTLGYHSWSLIFKVVCPTGHVSNPPSTQGCVRHCRNALKPSN